MSYQYIDDIWDEARKVASECDNCSIEDLNISIGEAKKYNFCKKHHREFYSRYEKEDYSEDNNEDSGLEKISLNKLIDTTINSKQNNIQEFMEVRRRIEKEHKSVERQLFGGRLNMRSIIGNIPLFNKRHTVSDLIEDGYFRSMIVESLSRKYPDKMVNYTEEIEDIIGRIEVDDTTSSRIQGFFILSLGYIALENNRNYQAKFLEDIEINGRNKKYINLALSLASINKEVKDDRGLMHDEREFLDPAKFREEIVRAVIVYFGYCGDKEDLELIELMETPKRSFETEKEIERAKSRISKAN